MKPLMIFLILSTPAVAGEISKPGATIEVENYRCTATSSRTLSCRNIGWVCEAQRKLEKETNDHYIGCGLDEWKAKHPKESCPDTAGWNFAGQECLDTILGGY